MHEGSDGLKWRMPSPSSLPAGFPLTAAAVNADQKQSTITHRHDVLIDTIIVLLYPLHPPCRLPRSSSLSHARVVAPRVVSLSSDGAECASLSSSLRWRPQEGADAVEPNTSEPAQLQLPGPAEACLLPEPAAPTRETRREDDDDDPTHDRDQPATSPPPPTREEGNTHINTNTRTTHDTRTYTNSVACDPL